MKRFEVNSGYRQFYVADAGLEPDAPEVWNDTHVAQRHNTLQNIVALCPEGDITARVISIGPDEQLPDLDDRLEFEVETAIEVPSGRIGVFGWPWAIQDEYQVDPGTYIVRFFGYALDRAADEEDYYVVQIRVKEAGLEPGTALKFVF